MVPIYSDHFILSSEDCATVQVLFFVSTIKQFVMCEKRLFFNVLKVILLENNLPFWDCLYGLRTLSNATHDADNQKTVTAWFSGNALISTELLI